MTRQRSGCADCDAGPVQSFNLRSRRSEQRLQAPAKEVLFSALAGALGLFDYAHSGRSLGFNTRVALNFGPVHELFSGLRAKTIGMEFGTNVVPK